MIEQEKEVTVLRTRQVIIEMVLEIIYTTFIEIFMTVIEKKKYTIYPML